jgi:glutathione S-transferase
VTGGGSIKSFSSGAGRSTSGGIAIDIASRATEAFAMQSGYASMPPGKVARYRSSVGSARLTRGLYHRGGALARCASRRARAVANTASMITLYHAPKSRSSRFIWLLEEINEPYEVKTVSIRRGDGSGATDEEYRKIHPHGKVPAIQHDGGIVFESAAIAIYLGDAFPKARLAPPVGDPQRGAYLTWLAYYAGVLEPAFVTKSLGFNVADSRTGWAPTGEILDYVSSTLARGDYLLGPRFTTADVLYGSTLALFKNSPLVPKNEVLSRYVDKVTRRVAYQRALTKDA